ncbi:type VI secretion system-associated protein TagF [Saccharospirillum alexandrii]|uniref:type VI secretion system-associated protein TagF n=1 Tax=Saccharospirillum alexandrii TaxID=2448477 RepID=UPI00373528F8
MFGFKPEKPAETVRPDPVTLGFLGKLPDRADYVHSASGSREVQTLDASLKEWLSLQAAQQAADATTVQTESSSGVGFLQVGGHDRQGMSGYVFPSEDSHGRRYPFMYFSRWSDTELYFKPAPLFFGSWMQFGKTNADLAWPDQLPDLSTFDRFRNASASADMSAGKQLMKASLAYLSEISLQRWLSHLVGGDPVLQIRLLAGCRDLIDNYRSRRHRPMTDLELPLGPKDMAPVSLVFWLHVLTPVGSDSLWRPDVLWSLNPAGGKVWILARPLAGSHWQQAIKPAPGSDWSTTGQLHRHWAEQLVGQADVRLLDVAIRWSQME